MKESTTYDYHKEKHNFHDSQKIGLIGEAIIDDFLINKLGWTIVYVPLETEELEGKYDRVFLDPKTGDTHVVEEKYDKGGDVSPNICLELYSNYQSKRKGWMLESKATLYVVLIRSTIHIMSMPELHQWYQNNLHNYFDRLRRIPNSRDYGGYESSVIIPPKAEVFAGLESHKSHDALGYMEKYNRGELDTGSLIRGKKLTDEEHHRKPGKGLINNTILNTEFEEQ